ncbi:MAG TPA: hypothetical protein VHE59_16650 [Mucilaginibacter sp.]|nr:hypothetical protein [Mucilaginibacter sp.]
MKQSVTFAVLPNYSEPDFFTMKINKVFILTGLLMALTGVLAADAQQLPPPPPRPPHAPPPPPRHLHLHRIHLHKIHIHRPPRPKLPPPPPAPPRP